jgi:poly(beta-D-mannuronate) lyase
MTLQPARLCRTLLLAAICAAHCLAQVPSQTLVSPWDIHPPHPHDTPYACNVPAPLPKDIVAYDFYSDAKHSIIDPTRYAAYTAAAKRFEDTTHAAESAADSFQSSGSQAAANCVLQVLLTDANAGSMTGEMASNQSNYVQNWTLGALAVTWLKVRSAEPGSPADRQLVTAWLDTVAGKVHDYFAERHGKGTTDSSNNHYYWAGFAVMGSAIAANDRPLFDWAVSTYDDGIGRIQPDGTLPLEMARGQRALHYHLFALAPLVTMAELGTANGLDLYTRDRSALSRLIYRSLGGLMNNSFFAEKAGAPQDTPEKGKIKSDDVAAVVPYLRRYPNAQLSALAGSVTLKPYNYLGGMPPP